MSNFSHLVSRMNLIEARMDEISATIKNAEAFLRSCSLVDVSFEELRWDADYLRIFPATGHPLQSRPLIECPIKDRAELVRDISGLIEAVLKAHEAQLGMKS